jgi:hypothetical protein
LEQRFTITHEYPVIFARGVLRPEAKVLDGVFERLGSGPFRVMAVLDSGVVDHWPNLVGDLGDCARRSGFWQLSGEPQIVLGGEACKNDPAVLARINAQAYELGLDRHSFVLAIGGGADQPSPCRAPVPREHEARPGLQVADVAHPGPQSHTASPMATTAGTRTSATASNQSIGARRASAQPTASISLTT